MNTILMLILKDVVLPEMISWLDEFMNDNNRLPTKAELEAKLTSLGERIIQQGNEFLNRIKNE